MHTNDHQQPDALELLEDAVHRFQQLRASGQHAGIEDFVPRVPQPIREQLFRRLLSLEFELQSRSGETFAVRDYRQQFPEYRDVIDSVVQELSHPPDQTAQGHDSTLDEARRQQQRATSAEQTLKRDLRNEARGEVGLVGSRIGDYEILEEIARGGMGVVYKARQLKLNRIVALKMILAGQFASHDDVLRFYSEAEAAARLDHPGIVPIYEVDEFEGKHYFSMGFVDGESLQQRVGRSPLRQQEAARLVQHVAEAVHYAHQQGVVHRDLKPRNILMSSEGYPKVTDFGLAKCIEEDGGLTISGQILGTPGYMPPEQALGKLEGIGPRADVYALGAVLYCLLTGRPPFQSATVVETIKQVLETPPPSPRVLNPEIDRDLETICLKCLEKQPDHRYQSAAEVADELRRYLAGEPIKARRVGIVVRSARWLRRRPLVVAIGSLLLLLALVTPATVLVGMRTFEARRLADLQHRIDAGLDAPQLTQQWMEEMDALLAELEQINPALADDESRRLRKVFGQAIRQEKSRPRLDEALVVSLRTAIDLLESRDKELAATLRTELEQRLRDWQELFTLSAPFGNAAEVFEPGDFQLIADRLEPQVAVMNDARRALTRFPSGGLVQLEARFDESWQETSRIGLSLRADAQRGYDFVLLADDARTIRDDLPGADSEPPEKLTFRVLREREAYFTLAIYRNGLLLIREQVPAADVPAGPLVMRATCDQTELQLHAGPQHSVAFRDPFPLPARQPGVFAVHWPRDVGLLELVARTKPKPAAVSPLERGDEMFGAGDFAQALEQYRQQALQTEDVEFQQESRYKQALCHLQLNRLDDAAALFDAIMKDSGERWPPIAGCQLWLIRLEEKRYTEADSVFDFLSTHFRFDQVASLIPQELRQEILASYHSDLETISTVMRFNPDLMLKLRRLAAVDRFLSIDGRGRELTQIEVARGYHLLGDLPSALQAAEQLALGSSNAIIQRHYLRLLRLNGEANEALTALELYRQQNSARREPEQDHLALEQARILAALNRWRECEQTLDRFASAQQDGKFRSPQTLTYYALMKGMLLQRRGASGPAQSLWREGYEGMREELRRVKGPNSEVVNAIILGSLCGDLTDEECHQFFTGVVNRGGDNAIARQAQTIIGPQVIADALREMWRSKLGRKCAEDFAFERLSLRDRIKVPVVLLAMEYFNQSVFHQEMTDEQRQAVFDVIAAGYDETIYEGKINISHVAQIILAWKGTANFLGWGGVAPSLSPRFRGGVAYVLAHRYLKLGDQPQALKFLDTAIADYPPESAIARLALKDKELLAAKAGRLVIDSDLPEPAQLLVTLGDQQVAAVDVAPGQEIDVPAGELKLSLATTREDFRLGPAAVSITPMGRRHVRLQWLWNPAADVEPLIGLVSQPAVNAVGMRWQIAFRHPPQEVRALAFSHDGRRLVAGSDDGLLRIYSADTQQLQGVLAPAPGKLQDVVWAPSQDRIVAGGADFWLRGWNADTGRMMFERNDHRLAVAALAASGNGSRFASCSHSHHPLAILWSAGGSPISTWKQSDYGAANVALSADDKYLAWVPTLPQKAHTLEVIELATGRTRVVSGEPGRHYSWIAFSPDSHLLAAGGNMQDIRLWRTSDWQVAAMISMEGGNIHRLMWTPDGNRLLAGIANTIVEIDVTQDPPVESVRYPAAGLLRCGLSPDGRTLLASHGDGRMSLIHRSDSSAKSWGEQVREPLGLAVRPGKSGELAVVGQDGILRRLDSQGRQVATVPLPQTMPITSAAWSRDGTQLAASLNHGAVMIYQPDGPWRALLPNGTAGSGSSVAWTAAGKLVVLSRDRKVHLIDPSTGVVLSSWDIPSGSEIAIDSGDQLILWSTTGEIELRDFAGSLKMTLAKLERAVAGAFLSPNGDCIAVRWPNGLVALWSMESERLIELPETHAYASGVVWSPSGRHLATASSTGEVRIWGDEGKRMHTFPPPFPGRINSLAWIDDDRLATAGEDTAVRIWNAATGQPETMAALLPGDRWACFAASGRLLGSSAAIEDDLIYLLENSHATLELLRPSEFAARLGQAGVSIKPVQPEPTKPPQTPVETPSKEAEQLPTRELAIVQDAAIVESSGLAVSSRDDSFWTHNDDEKFPRLYLLSRSGETLGRFDLLDVKHFDWEDICAFERAGQRYLLVGDMGDNRAARTDCRLLLVQEPDLTKLKGDVVAVSSAVTIPFNYDDGPHDCEALAVDADRNVALLITKELDATCMLYEIPLEHRGDTPAVAKRVRELKLPLVTAMDISPDGRRLVVLGGLHAFEWSRDDKEPWTKALDRVPRRYPLPPVKQPEAIAYRRDGKALLLTSEGEHQPLWEMSLSE